MQIGAPQEGVPVARGVGARHGCCRFPAVKAPKGLVVLLAFFGLFRVNEMLTLRVGQLSFLRANLCHMVLADSKGAQHKGSPETAQVKDAGLIRLLKQRCEGLTAHDLLFPFTCNNVYIYI